MEALHPSAPSLTQLRLFCPLNSQCGLFASAFPLRQAQLEPFLYGGLIDLQPSCGLLTGQIAVLLGPKLRIDGKPRWNGIGETKIHDPTS
jgi:hypothetical protein